MSPNAGGGVAGSHPMSTAVHRSPNKLWRFNPIFNLCLKKTEEFLSVSPMSLANEEFGEIVGKDYLWI
jgi:hypothetical protein